jgi:hypothetical protein
MALAAAWVEARRRHFREIVPCRESNIGAKLEAQFRQCEGCLWGVNDALENGELRLVFAERCARASQRSPDRCCALCAAHLGATQRWAARLRTAPMTRI